MRNIEVIKQFLNKSSGNSNSKNLISDGVRLLNYSTCIAEWADDFVLFINVTKYSRSTSRIQSMILRELKTLIHKSVSLGNVPINTKYLWTHARTM